jgi:hypothetical protein
MCSSVYFCVCLSSYFYVPDIRLQQIYLKFYMTMMLHIPLKFSGFYRVVICFNTAVHQNKDLLAKTPATNTQVPIWL